MLRRIAVVTPTYTTPSRELIADILKGQVATAGGMLEWLQARAKDARRAWRSFAFLFIVTALIQYILWNVRRRKIEEATPEAAGSLIEPFARLSASMRRLIAAADLNGTSDRFGWRNLLRRFRRLAQECASLTERFSAIDAEWLSLVSEETQAKINIARQDVLTFQLPKHLSWPDTAEDAVPSDAALITHLTSTIPPDDSCLE